MAGSSLTSDRSPIHLLSMILQTHLRAVVRALCAGVLLVTTSAFAQAPAPSSTAGQKRVTVTISPSPDAPDLAPQFVGASYEMRIVLPENGKYYFDADDENLVRVYKTLGIKSLR